MFLLLLLYRIPEALLSKISTLFLIDAIHNDGLGLSPQEFGFTQGTVGIIAFVLGSVLGRFSISHSKFKKQLIPIKPLYTNTYRILCMCTLVKTYHPTLSLSMPLFLSAR